MEANTPREDEEWRPVVGYEGRYEVSNYGGIKRVCGGKGTKRPILSPVMSLIGYRVVVLSHGTIATRKRLYVHRLVAAAFIGPCPDRFTVNHIDHNKENNHPSNLEYVTQLDNTRAAWNAGVCPVGERNGHAKLTEEDVRTIRSLRGIVTQRELGKRFGIHCAQVCWIQLRKSWKHVA